MLHNCHIQESSSTAAAFTWEPKMRKLFRSPPPVYELEALLGNYKGGTHHVDQVFPNLFLGDVNIARDRKKLRTMGITHILNVAHASWEFTGDNIDYGPDIQYYGITIEDCPDFDISVFLRPGAKFIHNALSTPGGCPKCDFLQSLLGWYLFLGTIDHGVLRITQGSFTFLVMRFFIPFFNGKVLVHCVLGKSRSATMVLAYLMIYQRFTLADAIRHVSQYRCIAPNRGFLQQLQHLEMELHYTFWRCYMF
ncbi:dual specificity protein phosphatase 13A-like isoform X1 [Lithobates pipiens]